MKTLKFLWLFFAACLFVPPLALASADPGELRISLIRGDVQVQTEDFGAWVPASINMPLMETDRVWVPEGGLAELSLEDGTRLRLDQNSSLDVLDLDSDTFHFELESGRAYANYKGYDDEMLQIDTPSSTVYSYRRLVFMLHLRGEDGGLDVSVLSGKAYFEGGNGRTGIRAGEELSVLEGSDEEIDPLGPPDSWERWNRARDERQQRQYSGPDYLPEELSSYAGDLDANGRWVYAGGYGYCWRPLYVAPGWAPYRVGRWVWMGGDYVWVSYESWGWAPYHYGRWVYAGPEGWCWVPPARGEVYWGPGYVGWVYTPNYVAWVPLAPGEVYYGYGYYGPRSVNITNVNVRTTTVNIYKNVYVNNAVTVVNQKTFFTGRPAPVKTSGNPFLVHRISVGRPAIQPVRQTFMPVIRSIPVSKRPPARIQSTQVRQLRETHQLIRPSKTAPAGVMRSPARAGTVPPVHPENIRPGPRQPQASPRQPENTPRETYREGRPYPEKGAPKINNPKPKGPENRGIQVERRAPEGQRQVAKQPANRPQRAAAGRPQAARAKKPVKTVKKKQERKKQKPEPAEER